MRLLVNIKIPDKIYDASISFVSSYFNANTLLKYKKLDWLTFNAFTLILVTSDKREIPTYEYEVKDGVLMFSTFFNNQPLKLALNIIHHEDSQMIEAIATASEKTEDNWNQLSSKEQEFFTYYPFSILEMIEHKFRKDKKKILKYMPKPSEKKRIRESEIYYEAKPIYVRDCVIQYVYEPHEPNSYIRHCESWEVRGHWRHYKNGKDVFIKPYKKGKGLIKNTTYIIQN